MACLINYLTDYVKNGSIKIKEVAYTVEIPLVDFKDFSFHFKITNYKFI